jgi:hypothetical protein
MTAEFFTAHMQGGSSTDEEAVRIASQMESVKNLDLNDPNAQRT